MRWRVDFARTTERPVGGVELTGAALAAVLQVGENARMTQFPVDANVRVEPVARCVFWLSVEQGCGCCYLDEATDATNAVALAEPMLASFPKEWGVRIVGAKIEDDR